MRPVEEILKKVFNVIKENEDNGAQGEIIIQEVLDSLHTDQDQTLTTEEYERIWAIYLPIN